MKRRDSSKWLWKSLSDYSTQMASTAALRALPATHTSEQNETRCSHDNFGATMEQTPNLRPTSSPTSVEKLEGSQGWADFVDGSWFDFEVGALLLEPNLADLAATLELMPDQTRGAAKGDAADQQPRNKPRIKCPHAETHADPSSRGKSTKRGCQTDGWSKYGQKRVKHGGVPRAVLKTSFKCNSPNCAAKKVVYKHGKLPETYVFHGQHNHHISHELMTLMCLDSSCLELHEPTTRRRFL